MGLAPGIDHQAVQQLREVAGATGRQAVKPQHRLWRAARSEVTGTRYKDFYKGCRAASSKMTAHRLHLSLDAPYQFQAILCIPTKPPFDLAMDRDKRRGMQLACGGCSSSITRRAPVAVAALRPRVVDLGRSAAQRLARDPQKIR